jgi:hypothetical protein
MAHKPPNKPPSGPKGREHVSPLGNHHVDGGGQILRGGGSSGPLIRSPLKYREREEGVTRGTSGSPGVGGRGGQRTDTIVPGR